jgi:hypothetical protein
VFTTRFHWHDNHIVVIHQEQFNSQRSANFKESKDTKGGPQNVDHPLKGGLDERSYILKGGWRNCNLTSYRAGSFQMVSDLTYPPPGSAARHLWVWFWAGFLRPLANHTVTTLWANGFISGELLAANWACIWNIKDLVGIHFRLTPGSWAIMGNS